jgi:hypothetical protein
MSALDNGKREKREYLFLRQQGKCYWCKGQMTLEHPGRPPKNYASFEHMEQRRYGGHSGAGNIVLACRYCNNKRDAGIQTSIPKPDNVMAQRMRKSDLKLLLAEGVDGMPYTLVAECYKRGLLPNWPMWTKFMAHIPLGNP